MARSPRYSTPPTIRRYRVPPPRRSSTAQITLRFVVLAAVATLIIGSLLAVQMANGSDPALGPKAVAKAKKEKPAATGSSTGATETDRYGDGGYAYGSSDSGGYSSGYSGQSAPAPVTSSTS